MVAIELMKRGPATALGIFMAAASFGAGSVMITLHNAVLDCSNNASPAGVCGVDILEVVVGALVAVGGVAGSTFIGLTTPLPRDLANTTSHASPLTFQVDGQDVKWEAGMKTQHAYGINRTADNPAVIEYQHNASTPAHKYTVWQQDDLLVSRHPTGFEMADPTSWTRATCETYFDVSIAMDTLRKSELSANPGYAGYHAMANALLNFYVSHRLDDACVFFGTDDGIAGAKFGLGASCGKNGPVPRHCGNANYDTPVFALHL